MVHTKHGSNVVFPREPSSFLFTGKVSSLLKWLTKNLRDKTVNQLTDLFTKRLHIDTLGTDVQCSWQIVRRTTHKLTPKSGIHIWRKNILDYKTEKSIFASYPACLFSHIEPLLCGLFSVRIQNLKSVFSDKKETTVVTRRDVFI